MAMTASIGASFAGDPTIARYWRPSPVRSLRTRLFLHFSQHADHKRQQLLQRVEARHLARH
jgi:hypothetical protein